MRGSGRCLPIVVALASYAFSIACPLLHMWWLGLAAFALSALAVLIGRMSDEVSSALGIIGMFAAALSTALCLCIGG